MRILRIVGVVSLALLPVFALLVPQWNAVVATWFDGEPTSGLTVWGTPMLVWGRIGKLLQFVAGLAVVLDLLDPEKLRARGIAARDRLTELGEQALRRRRGRKLHLDGQRLFDWLVKTDKKPFAVEGGFIMVNVHHLRPEFRLRFRLAGFDESELRHLSQRVRSRLGDSASELNKSRRDEIRAEIAALMLQKYPDDAEQMNAHTTSTTRLTRIVSVASVLGYFPCAIGVFMMMEYRGDWLVGTFAPTAFLVFVFLGLIALIGLVGPEGLIASNPSGTVATLQLLIRLPIVTFYTFAARILDKARPGHVLRWIAFFLFLHGFVLDLLAS